MSKAVRGPLFRRALWLLVGAILGAGLVWVIHPVPAGGPARQPRVVDRVPAEDVLMPATGSIEVRLSVEVEAEET
nr:hypothetical protein [Desulfuromonadales bacterium]